MYARIEGIPQKNLMYRVSAAKECIIGMTKYRYNLCWRYLDEYSDEDIIKDMNELMEILSDKHQCDVVRVEDMRHGALLYALSQNQINIIRKEWITWYEAPISNFVPKNDIGGFQFRNREEFLKYRWADWVSFSQRIEDTDCYEYLERMYKRICCGLDKSGLSSQIIDYVKFHPSAFYLFNDYDL